MKKLFLIFALFLPFYSFSAGDNHKNTINILGHDESGEFKVIGVVEDKLAEIINIKIAKKPDQEFTESRALEVLYLLEINGKRYGLDKDELILFGKPERVWEIKGIEKKVFDSIKKTKVQQ